MSNPGDVFESSFALKWFPVCSSSGLKVVCFKSATSQDREGSQWRQLKVLLISETWLFEYFTNLQLTEAMQSCEDFALKL